MDLFEHKVYPNVMVDHHFTMATIWVFPMDKAIILWYLTSRGGGAEAAAGVLGGQFWCFEGLLEGLPALGSTF